MRKLLLLLCLGLLLLSIPFTASAEEFTAPTAPENVQELMPAETVSFGKDLWTVFIRALETLHPEFVKALQICTAVAAAAILVGVLQNLPGSNSRTMELAGVVCIAVLLCSNAGTMILLGKEVINEISDYGKLLLPVMTAALAAQGGITSSGSLYGGTVIFNSILNTVLRNLLIPMVYLFLAVGIASSATGNEMLSKLKDFLKWITTWCLKTLLYVFTGYMGITGVISGTVDAATLKATKLTMSGMIPVVGGILSDASEAVLVGASVMKNSAGIYGILAVIGILIIPFFKIGIQYFMLKLTATFCEVLGSKSVCGIVNCFSTAMGLLLGMASACATLVLISTVCFMRGVG